MHTKIMEREKFLVLSTAEDNFEAEMVLLASIQDDLFWWRNVFFDLSQHNVRSGQFALEIFTDASLTEDREQSAAIFAFMASGPQTTKNITLIFWNCLQFSMH